jgi:cyclase
MRIAILAFLTFTAYAQQAVDYSKVEIKTTKLAPNFYTLEGSGGTIGVLAGPDGILMVDSQFAPLTDKIVAAIHQISPAPIRFMIDTHVHPDHTGGNENLGKLGVAIFAREELRARLIANKMPAAGLPVVTYSSPLTFHLNGEEAVAMPVLAAHTDGDTLVWFPKSNVIMIGDFFRTLGYPNIDRANGGSLNGMMKGIEMAMNLCGPDTKVVPGHGAITDRAGLAAHLAMIQTIRDRVAKLIQEGKTSEQIVASHPTADYDSKVPGVGTTADRFVGQLYAELTLPNK